MSRKRSARFTFTGSPVRTLRDSHTVLEIFGEGVSADGTLHDQSGENQLTGSEDLTQSDWQTLGATIASTPVLLPDGKTGTKNVLHETYQGQGLEGINPASRENSGNAVLGLGDADKFDGQSLEVSAVLNDSGTYKAWTTGRGLDSQSFASLMSRLNDGDPVLSLGLTGKFDEQAITQLTALIDSGTFRGMHAGRGFDGNSNFMVPLTKQNSGNEILSPGASGTFDSQNMLALSVLNDNGVHKMWHAGQGSDPSSNFLVPVTRQNSGDCVLDLGDPGTFDQVYAYYATVLLDGSTYRMWYSGFDGYNWRIGYATSTDKLTWTKKNSGNPVLDLGSQGQFDSSNVYAPCVVKDGADWRMWYAGNSGGQSKIGCATSSDGITWTRQNSGNPVLNWGQSGKFDDAGVDLPSVFIDGATYKMWYSGYRGGVFVGIGYATSTDGITWSRQNSGDAVLVGGVSGKFDDTQVRGCSVQKISGAYKMIYSGLHGSNWQMGYANSTDGLIWVKQNDGREIVAIGAGGKFDQTYAAFPSFFLEGSSYSLFYSGFDGTNGRLGYAVLDGTVLSSWERMNSGNCVFDVSTGSTKFDSHDVWAPSVLLDSGTYKMWFSGADASGNTKIGYATSSDGITWTKQNSENCVLDVGDVGKFDHENLGMCSVLKDGSTYRMWYVGYTAAGSYRIGYATSSDGISWTRQNSGDPILALGVGKFDSTHHNSVSVIKDGSTFKMWYGGYNGSLYAIGYATSADGITWTKQNSGNAVLAVTASRFDSADVFAPCVVLDSSGLYHMLYCGTDRTTYAIGYATSKDSITWTKDYCGVGYLQIGAAGKFDASVTQYATWLIDSGIHRIWYSGKDASSYQRIGYAILDPLNLTAFERKIIGGAIIDLGAIGKFDAIGTFSPSVIKDSSTYKMWYAGLNGNTIGYATSSDGVSWTKQNNGDYVFGKGGSGKFDVSGVSCPSVIKDGSTYRMWYAGSLSSHYRIGYATSSDGITWSRVSTDAVLDLGTSGNFDDYHCTHPCVIKDGSTYRMWYIGQKTSDSKMRIGYATSTDGSVWTRVAGSGTGGCVLDLNAGKFDSNNLQSPKVLKINSIYYMLYSGYNGTYYLIGLATSLDGINWTRQNNAGALTAQSTIGVDMRGHAYVCWLQDSSDYKIWLTAYDATTYRILYATMSLSSLVHTKQPGRNGAVLDVTASKFDSAGVQDGIALLDSGTYYMWYSGSANGTVWKFGCATSTDGITWTKQNSGNAVLDLGTSGKFDDTSLDIKCVIKDGATYKMWYSGLKASDSKYRIGYATSSDGITWSRYTGSLTGSSVLDVNASSGFDDGGVSAPSVVKVGSTYYMWYVGLTGSTHRIGLATSPDGTTWTRVAGNGTGSCVLDLGDSGKFDQSQVLNPQVIQVNSVFVMVYTGYGSSTNQIGYATSLDGINWTRQNAANPIIATGLSGQFDYSAVSTGNLVSASGNYFMWYTGNSGSKFSIGMATLCTSDLIFSKKPGAMGCILDLGVTGKFDSGSVSLGRVINDSGTYKMWYSGQYTDGKWRLGYASSPDGRTWTKNYGGGTGYVMTLGTSGYFDDNGVCYASVLKDGSTYKMWYSGLKASDSKYRIGYATSSDGTTWTRQNGGNAVLDLGASGKFDVGGLLYPTVIYENNTYHMWYAGYNNTDWVGIGYATSSDGLTWVRKNSGDAVLTLGASGKFDDSKIFNPSVCKVGPVYLMVYSGYRSATSKFKVGYASSLDGINWIRQNNGDEILSAGSSQFDSSRAYEACLLPETLPLLYYTGYDGTYYRIGLATMGLSDTIFAKRIGDNGPRLDVGAAGQWDSSSVPYGAVLYESGTWHMWYAGRSVAGLNQGIGYASSTDGRTFTRYGSNPVLTPTSGRFDSAGFGALIVIKDGSTYKMWYSGTGSDSKLRIGYATSTDRVTWTKVDGSGTYKSVLDITAAAWDSTHVYAPVVIKDGSTYKMWYSGSNNTTDKIGYATSSDGISWSKSGSNPVLSPGSAGKFDQTGVFRCSVIKDGSTYRMLYTGYDNTSLRLGYATSSDGTTWTRQNSSNAVMDLGSPSGQFDDTAIHYPCIVQNPLGDSVHYIYYGGSNSSPVYTIGLATTMDFLNMNRQGYSYYGETLRVGVSGKFDANGVYGGSVINDSGTYRMWYSGQNASGNVEIGYATSLDKITWTRQNSGDSVLPRTGGQFDSTHTLYPCVYKDGSTYRMWYTGSNGTTYLIGYATSSDGITWSKNGSAVVPVGTSGNFDDAGTYAPCVLWDATNSRWDMWYAGKKNSDSKWRIGYAYSSNGTSWTKVAGSGTGGCVIDLASGKFDSNYAVHPLVYKDGSVYRMLYTGYDGTNQRIGGATSADKISWTKKNNGNAIIDLGASGKCDSSSLLAGSFLVESNVLHYWYGASDGTTYRVGYAQGPTSAPAANATKQFSYDGEVISYGSAGKFDVNGIIGISVLYESSIYKAWYAGEDGSSLRIGYLTSADGLNWNRQNSGDPIMSLGVTGKFDTAGMSRPCVINDGGTYKMWYQGQNGSSKWSIGYATSSDGLNWIRQNSGNAVLDVGAGGKFDATHAFAPSVIKDGSTYRMWYSGDNSTNQQIGYATSSDGITWTKQNSGNPVIAIGSGFDSVRANYCSVIKSGSLFIMAYSGYNNTKYEIGYATSTDGLSWVKQNNLSPVILLGASGKFDSAHALVPFMYLNGTLIQTWYRSGVNSGRIGYAACQLASPSATATTQNSIIGETFCYGNSGKFDASIARFGCVIYDSSIYKQWYVGYSSNNQIGYATSLDGKAWIRQNNGDPVLPLGVSGKFDDTETSMCCVINDSGTYKMWYTGCYSSDSKYRIGYATSADGIYWTRQNSGNAVLDLGAGGKFDSYSVAAPCVIKDGATYRMWYMGCSSANTWIGIGYATSSDGITWTRQNSSNAVLGLGRSGKFDATQVQAPCVLLNSGLFTMFYTGVKTSTSLVGVATSVDGINWIRKNNANALVSLGATGKFDATQVTNAWVIQNGTLREMFYTGFDTTSNKWREGYAASQASSPSISITKQIAVYSEALPLGVTGMMDAHHITAPCIFLDSGVYKMWYSAWDGASTYGRIAYAISLDKIVWTKQNDQSCVLDLGLSGKFDDASVDYPCVINDGGMYKMWYTGTYSSDSKTRIGYATSTDGISWTRQNSGNAVLDLGTSTYFDDASVGSCCVIKDGSTYRMWYAGLKASDSVYRIGYATSSDGISWTRQNSGNAVLDVGLGKFDSSYVTMPWAIKISSTYHMLYRGSDSTNERLGYATSSDGTNWTKQNSGNCVLDQSVTNRADAWSLGSPCFFQDGSAYVLFYIGSPSATSHRVCLATALGVSRQNSGNQVLDFTPFSFDLSQVFAPTVLNDAGTYKMWYAGSDGTNERIGYATSTNKTTWTRQNGGSCVVDITLGAFDSSYATAPCVLKDGSTYKMWYTGKSSSDSKFRIGYATSSDGVTWSKYSSSAVLDLGSSLKFDDNGVYGPYVIKDGTTYRMWYAGIKASDSIWRIGYATSLDGTTWTRQNSGNAVLDVNAAHFDSNGVAFPCVVKVDSTFHMLYRGSDGSNYRVGYATSDNGVNWTRQYSSNCVIDLGGTGKFDVTNVDRPSFFSDSGTFVVFYAGKDASTWRIGYMAAFGSTRQNSGDAVLSIGTTRKFDSYHASQPSILNDSGTYKMWYSGYNGAKYQIGYATSFDKASWTKQNGGAPVLTTTNDKFDSNSLFGCCVLKDSGTYKMWYSGFNGTKNTIGYATSSDGTSWTKQNSGNAVLDVTSSKFDSAHVYYPTVIKDGSTYRMWYSGNDGSTTQIGYATSSDGIIWNKQAQNTAVIQVGSSGDFDSTALIRPYVVNMGAFFLMMYTGANDAGRYTIGYATSTDGVTWTKLGSGAILTVGNSGKFDDYDVLYPCMLQEGGTFDIWYSGSRQASANRIGYATGNAFNARVGYETSSNRTSWSRENSGLPVLNLGSSGKFDEFGVEDIVVLKDSSTYRAWFTGTCLADTKKRIGYATSSDGLTWTRQNSGNAVLDVGAGGSWESQAVCQPTVVKDGSTYRMWYVGFDGTTYKIGYATSSDGSTWSKSSSNPVLTVGTSGKFDETGVYRPSVQLYGTTFILTYTGLNSSGVETIGYATSTNGTSWTRLNSSNALFSLGSLGKFDYYAAAAPSLVIENSACDIFYLGTDTAGGTKRIGLITGNLFNSRLGYDTSSDGLSWTKQNSGACVLNLGASGKFDDFGLEAGSLLKDSTTYKLWYTGTKLSDGKQRIGYATSSDCITWTRQNSSNEVLSVGTGGSWDANHVCQPCVLKIGSSDYRMWYAGFDGTTYQIGYATSSDGISWSKSSSNPVLGAGASGKFDVGGVKAPSVVQWNSKFLMLYTGLDGSGVARLGLALSSDGISWTRMNGADAVLLLGSGGAFDAVGVQHPSLLVANGTASIFYAGTDSNATSQVGLAQTRLFDSGIGYATSANRISWTRQNSSLPVLTPGASGKFDDLRIEDAAVVKDGSIYRMWYTGSSTVDSHTRIGYATSSDGITWSRQNSGDAILSVGSSGAWDDEKVCQPFVYKAGPADFRMWYAGFDGTSWRIGYATSANGTSWTKSSSNPVLDLGATGKFDSDGVFAPCVQKEAAEAIHPWILLYTGKDALGVDHVGYALSANGIAWTRSDSGDPILALGDSSKFDEAEVRSPRFEVSSNSLKIWYTGIDANGTGKVGLASASEDWSEVQSEHRASQLQQSLEAGKTYYFSAVIQPNYRNWAAMRVTDLYGDDEVHHGFYVNAQDGSLGANIPGSSILLKKTYPNPRGGWKVEMQFQAEHTADYRVGINIARQNSQMVYVGADEDALNITRVQFVELTDLTKSSGRMPSYVETTSAPKVKMDLTAYGDPQIVPTAIAGKRGGFRRAIQFNGTDQYYQGPSLGDPEIFTKDHSITLNLSVDPGSGDGMIWSAYRASPQGGLTINYWAQEQRLIVLYYSLDDAKKLDVAFPPDGKFRRVVITRQNNVGTLWLDNWPACQRDLTGFGLSTGTESIFIGSDNGQEMLFKGQLEYLRLDAQAISDARRHRENQIFQGIVPEPQNEVSTPFDLIRPSTGTLRTSLGEETQVLSNAIRMGSAARLRNLVQKSNLFTDSIWAPVGSSPSAYAGLDPDGGTRAFTLHEDSSDGPHEFTQLLGKLATGSYTVKIKVKSLNRTQFALAVGPSRTSSYAIYNLTDYGTIQTQSAVGRIEIAPDANGFFKLRQTFEVTDASQAASLFLGAAASGSLTFQGLDQDSLVVYKVQLEEGFIESSDSESLNEAAPMQDFVDYAGIHTSLQIAPRATNLVRHSQDFTQTAWGKESCTVSPGTPQILVESAGTNVHDLYQVMTLDAETTYTFKVFVGAQDRKYTCVRLTQASNNQLVAKYWVDLAQNSISPNSDALGRLELANDGTVGLVFIATTLSETSYKLTVHAAIDDDPNHLSYTGTGCNALRLIEAQAVPGVLDLPFVPTAASSASQEPEACSFLPYRLNKDVLGNHDPKFLFNFEKAPFDGLTSDDVWGYSLSIGNDPRMDGSSTEGAFYQFDGWNSLYVSGSQVDFNLGGAFSLVAIVAPASLAENGIILAKAGSSWESQTSFRLWHENGALHACVSADGTETGLCAQATSPVVLEASSFASVVMSYEPTGHLKLYCNGSEVASADAVGPMFASNCELSIAADGSWQNNFNGRMGKVAVLEESLSLSDVQEMYGLFKQDGLLPLVIGGAQASTRLFVEVCAKAPFSTSDAATRALFLECSGNSGSADATHNRFGLQITADGKATAYLRDSSGVLHQAQSSANAVRFDQFHTYRIVFDLNDFSASTASIDGSSALIANWTGKTGSGVLSLQDTRIRLGSDLDATVDAGFIRSIRLAAL